MTLPVVVVTPTVQAVQVNSSVPGSYDSLARLGLGWYNVKESIYGATGNGTTDDTAAIRLAIAAAVTAGGGTIYFPPGTYLLSGNTDNLLINASNIHLWVAANAVLKKSGSGSAIWVGSTTSVSNVSIDGHGYLTPSAVPHSLASAGIKVGNAGKTVDSLTVGLNLINMGQYGIVSGSTSTTITNFVLRDGTQVSVDCTGWIGTSDIAQAMDFNLPSGSNCTGTIGAAKFSITDSIGLTDCFKWTGATSLRIQGAEFIGGAVDQLHLGTVSGFVVAGVRLVKTASGGTGLAFANTCANGVVSGFEGETTTTIVPMVYFGASATVTDVDLNGIRTNGYISADTATGATCTRVRFRDVTCASWRCVSATSFGSGELDGVRVAGLLHLNGSSNLLRNVDADQAGGSTHCIKLVGNSNILRDSRAGNTTDRGVRVAGNSNLLDNVLADTCTVAYTIESGTGNTIGRITKLNGSGSGTDSGTSTKFAVYSREVQVAVLSVPTETVLVSGVDASTANTFQVTLTAARTVGAPSSPITGQRISFLFLQDGTGGWAVSWNTVFKVSWSSTGNTAGKRSSVAFIYDGTNWIQDGAQVVWY